MSELGSGTVKLMIGRLLSMALGFGTAPIMGHLFSPESYGIAALIGQIVRLAAALSCLGYAQAIPMSVSGGETRGLVRLCILLTVVLMVPVLLLPLVGGDFIAILLGGSAPKRFLWFVPIIFLFSCLRQIGTYTLARERRFGWLAFAEASDRGVARPLQIALGWFIGGSALFLLLGTALGLGVSAAAAACVIAPVFLKKKADKGSGSFSIFAVAKKHQQFPKVQLWNTVLNVSSQSMPIILMGALFGAAMVGYYNFGRLLLTLPMAILGNSVAKVFYPEAAAEWHETQSMAPSIYRTVRILAATCIFPIVTVAVLGPVLFATAMGERWREAGVYTQIMSPWIIVALFSSPISTIFLIRKRAGLLFLYNVVLIAARPAALVTGKGLALLASPVFFMFLSSALSGSESLSAGGVLLGIVGPAARFVQGWASGPRVALMLFSLAGFAVQLHLLATAMKLGHARRRLMLPVLLKETARGLCLLGPAAVAYWVFESSVFCFAFLGAAGLAKVALLYHSEPVVRTKLRDILGRVFREKAPAA